MLIIDVAMTLGGRDLRVLYGDMLGPDFVEAGSFVVLRPPDNPITKLTMKH